MFPVALTEISFSSYEFSSGPHSVTRAEIFFCPTAPRGAFVIVTSTNVSPVHLDDGIRCHDPVHASSVQTLVVGSYTWDSLDPPSFNEYPSRLISFYASAHDHQVRSITFKLSVCPIIPSAGVNTTKLEVPIPSPPRTEHLFFFSLPLRLIVQLWRESTGSGNACVRRGKAEQSRALFPRKGIMTDRGTIRPD